MGHAGGVSDHDAYLNLCVCGIIIMVVLIFDVVYFLDTMKRYKRFNTPQKDLLNLLNDTSNVLDAKSLQRRTRDVLAMFPSFKPDEDRTNSKPFLDGIAKAGQQCSTELVTGARDEGTLPIRTDNRLKLLGKNSNLHISQMHDLYGNPAFLAAAPLPSQFEDHWDAIWQAEIGIVVLVGRFCTHELRMDAYIGLKEGDEVKCGKFRIRTVESGDLVYKFALYYIQVRREMEKRELVFVHAYEWLQESVSWALERDVALVNCVKEEHVRRMKATGLRGIMFQCKFGTAGSASLFAAYVAFQTWLCARRVNMYGILRYVRKMRAMAFEQTGDKGHAFLTQVKVAYAAMYGVAKYSEKKRISKFEQWMKDVLSEPSGDSLLSQTGSDK